MVGAETRIAKLLGRRCRNPRNYRYLRRIGGAWLAVQLTGLAGAPSSRASGGRSPCGIFPAPDPLRVPASPAAEQCCVPRPACRADCSSAVPGHFGARAERANRKSRQGALSRAAGLRIVLRASETRSLGSARDEQAFRQAEGEFGSVALRV